MAKEDMRSCGGCGGDFDSKLEGVMCLECQCILCALCQEGTRGICPLCNGALDNEEQVRTCRECGCTDNDCRQCIEASGEPCHWVEVDLCGRCADEIEAACDHKNTYTDRIEATSTDIEICKDCGMSRAIYGDIEPSDWHKIDIAAAKSMCSVCFDDPVGKIKCTHCGGSGQEPEVDDQVPGWEGGEMSKQRIVRTVTGTAEHEYAAKVRKEFTEKEWFELLTAEKLARMTVQRTIQDVIAECDIAFCPYTKFVEGIESVMADDPLKAALDHARENDATCFAQYDKYYAIVPSFKSDMKGWIDAFHAWDRMRAEAAR